MPNPRRGLKNVPISGVLSTFLRWTPGVEGRLQLGLVLVGQRGLEDGTAEALRLPPERLSLTVESMSQPIESRHEIDLRTPIEIVELVH